MIRKCLTCNLKLAVVPNIFVSISRDLKPPLDLAGPWIKTIIGPNWDSMDSRGCLTTQMADIYRIAIIVISATLDNFFL